MFFETFAGMTQPITIAPLSARTGSGDPTHGSAAPVRAQVRFKRSRSVTRSGHQKAGYFEIKVPVGTAVALGSEVTLPSGFDPQVVRIDGIETRYDELGRAAYMELVAFD